MSIAWSQQTAIRMEKLLSWLVFIACRVALCRAYECAADCLTYRVDNVTSYDHGSLFTLDGYYNQSQTTPSQYFRNNASDAYFNITWVNYSTCVASIQFYKASRNLTWGDGHFNDFNTTSKCFSHSEDKDARICCTGTHEPALNSTFMSVLTLALLVQVICPLIHRCCARTCLTKTPSRRRIASIYCSLFLWPWAVYLYVQGSMDSASEDGGYSGEFYFGVAAFSTTYLVILVESFFSHERQYIKTVFTPESLTKHVTSLRQVAPRLRLWIKSWHYVRYTTKYYDEYKDGTRVYRSTSSYKIKYVTYNGKQEYEYDRCEDDSLSIDDIEILPGLTKIQFKLDVKYGDDYTSRRMKVQTDEMLSRKSDIEQKSKTIDDLPGMIKRASVLTGDRRYMLWMREPFYWLATLLGLSWPYRVIYRIFTNKIRYTFYKVVYIDNPNARAPRTQQGSATDFTCVLAVTGPAVIHPIMP